MVDLLIFVLAVTILIFTGSRVARVWLNNDSEQSVEGLALATPMPARGLQHALTVLDVRLQPLLFVAGLVLMSLAVCLAFLFLFPDRLGLAVVAGISFLPASVMVMRDLMAWRAQQFESELVDIIELMFALTKSGIPPLQSIEAAAGGAGRLARQSLQEVVRRLRWGDSIESATAHLLRLHPTEGVRLFVMVLRSRWQDGSNFESLLSVLARALRERRAYFAQVRGQLSGARYAMFFAGLFPYILIPFFLWREPDWLTPLSTHPLGPVFMYSAVMCQVAGFFWMRTITRSHTL